MGKVITAQGLQDVAAFEITNPVTGYVWRIFTDGHIEGFGGGNIVVNRIPALLNQTRVQVAHG